MHVGPWDVVLLVAVVLQSTAVAYLHDPRHKAIALCVPLPFTVAVLALGRPIDATYLWGLPLLLLFFRAVRVLYVGCGLNIVLAIVASALAYCAIAMVSAPRVPRSDGGFWGACLLAYAFAMLMERFMPPTDEPGHRSTLPPPVKIPIIAGVVIALILVKHHLQGFMAMFPMVSVVAAYETRHSLLTSARHMASFVKVMVPMLIACQLCQAALGIGPALAVGWCVFFSLSAPHMKAIWSGSAVSTSQEWRYK